jgi:hypothetical protein
MQKDIVTQWTLYTAFGKICSLSIRERILPLLMLTLLAGLGPFFNRILLTLVVLNN